MFNNTISSKVTSVILPSSLNICSPSQKFLLFSIFKSFLYKIAVPAYPGLSQECHKKLYHFIYQTSSINCFSKAFTSCKQ
ncbi:MAG: hypothetical protein LBC61_01920 [Candidatus Peribacteria bacterium]|nr:hypothetical protein [Candidatus Peribacteria bacterium]